MTTKITDSINSKLQDSVTIVIPFHNRVDLLIQAIESAVIQTYKNIEILLIDD